MARLEAVENDPFVTDQGGPRQTPAAARLEEVSHDPFGNSDWDYSGVPGFGIHADVGRGDNKEEKELRFGQYVGKNNIVYDNEGRMGTNAEGAARLGIKTQGKNLVFDSPETTLSDIADGSGAALPIAGALAAGFATGGMGFIPGVVGAFAGGAGGKLLDEGIETAVGAQRQSLGEVGKDALVEGALGATGEAGGRILIGAGRKLLNPLSGRLRNNAAQDIADSEELGFIPRAENIRKGRIVARMHGMVDSIFGDRNAVRNAQAASNEIQRLSGKYAQAVRTKLELGELIKEDIGLARKEFGSAAEDMYAFADDVLNGQAHLNIDQLQDVARQVRGKLPTKTVIDAQTGVPTKVPDPLDKELLPDLEKIIGWDGNQTLSAIQNIRRSLSDRIEGGVNQGTSSNEAGQLLKALNEGLVPEKIAVGGPGSVSAAQAAVVEAAKKSLKDANDFYAEGIKKFDNATIKKIMKNPSEAGELAPEKIVDFFFKKESQTPLKRVMDVLSPEKQAEVKRAAMDKITGDILTVDELGDELFDGFALKKTLDEFGDETMATMFGGGTAKELRKFSNVLLLASRQKTNASGGLIAAAIAVRPLQNLGTLAKFAVVRRFMSSEASLRWLTIGIQLGPKTSKGARALARVYTQMSTYATAEQAKEVANAAAAQQAAQQEQAAAQPQQVQ